MDFVQSYSSRGEYLDESTVLSMEWRQIDDAVLRGDLSFEQASAARKKLVRQMLGLVRCVEDGARVELGHD